MIIDDQIEESARVYWTVVKCRKLKESLESWKQLPSLQFYIGFPGRKVSYMCRLDWDYSLFDGGQPPYSGRSQVWKGGGRDWMLIERLHRHVVRWKLQMCSQ